MKPWTRLQLAWQLGVNGKRRITWADRLTAHPRKSTMLPSCIARLCRGIKSDGAISCSRRWQLRADGSAEGATVCNHAARFTTCKLKTTLLVANLDNAIARMHA